MRPRCLDTSERYSVACDRPLGHPGRHRGYTWTVRLDPKPAKAVTEWFMVTWPRGHTVIRPSDPPAWAEETV